MARGGALEWLLAQGLALGKRKMMKVMEFKGASVTDAIESMRRFMGESGAVPIRSEPVGHGVRLWYRERTEAGVHSGAMRSHFAK